MSVSGAIGSWRIGRLGVFGRVWLVLCAVIVWFGAPAAALASTGWSAPTDINGNNGLSSVSCPTSSFCVAVGPTNGVAVIYQDGSWGSPSLIDSGGTLTSVSCSSDSYCVAVDSSGDELTYENGSWGTPTSIDSGGMGMTSVSCPASADVPAPFCVAVDISGNAVIDQGGTWGTPTMVDSNGLIGAVSCPTSSFCMAVDLDGDEVSYNGSSWSSPVVVASKTYLSSVSCTSSSFCAAIGVVIGGGGINGYGFTWNGSSWSSGQELSAAVGSFTQTSVSCTSGTFCQAVYSSPDAAMFNGTSWTVESGIDTEGNLASVSCPTQAFCEAVDAAGYALTYTVTIPVPTVTSVVPDAGSTAGGNTVVINGTNFASGATVKFGSTGSSSVTFVSATRLKAVAPAESAGTVRVLVATPGGHSPATSNDLYAYGPPAITGLSPHGGAIAGGNTVTITGTGFVPGAVVKFGSTLSATVTFVSATQLKAVAPAESAGTVRVLVATPGGTSPATSADLYTYS
jgi:hypothetical protein